MKRLLAVIVASLPALVMAATSGVHLEHMTPDLEDKASLQRGVKTYLNYCMGCHSLKYQRYERTADDLGIPHEMFLENLVFDKSIRIGALMDNAMNTKKARIWFGTASPDLTLVTRLRGLDWVYTYLKTFYVDASRPFGVNNLVFENVGMPHIFMELQGIQIRKGCKELPKIAANGGEMRDPLTSKAITEEICGSEIIDRGFSPLELKPDSGKLTVEEYDQLVYDLVNFLYYVGEPSRLDRERIGVYVLFFLAFLFVFTYLLNREYWKDIH
ncbi:MAG: cytochrome c1 [Gammaproteobacteria bacterium]|nr:cytochrome c1 [Gammaproteobacteria bacterium]